MIELPFFSGLWIGFFIVALSSFGVFFAHSLKTIVLFSAITLSGICFTIFNTDLLRSSEFGQFIILALCLLFLFQSLFFGFFIKSEIKKTPIFYLLPFLAFVTIAISLDLITLLLGLTLFALCFVAIASFKRKSVLLLIASIQKFYVSFLAFSYGIACLYAREGTLLLKDIYLKLNRGNWDELTSIGFGLLFLSVLIEVYAIIPLIGKKNEL